MSDEDDARLDGIAARARAATPGPWRVGPTRQRVERRGEHLIEARQGADAEHVAGLDPDTALWLVGLVRSARAEAEQLRLERRDSHEWEVQEAVDRAVAQVESETIERIEAAARERDDLRAALDRVRAVAVRWQQMCDNGELNFPGIAQPVLSARRAIEEMAAAIDD